MGRRCEIVLRESVGHVVTRRCRYVLFLSENRSQTTDLGSESGANMLRLIGDQFLYARHNIVKKCFSFEQCTEAW